MTRRERAAQPASPTSHTPLLPRYRYYGALSEVDDNLNIKFKLARVGRLFAIL